MHAGKNPFSVQRIHSLAYVFEDGESLAGLAARFWESVGKGQRRLAICGGHGSGKSTLLRELGLFFAAAGTKVCWLDARGQVDIGFGGAGDSRTAGLEGRFQGDASSDASSGKCWLGQPVVLVDSGERYTWWEWQRIRWRYRGWALLTTSHRPDWLPVLYGCRPSFATFSHLCHTLLEGTKPSLLEFDDPNRLAELYARHEGDLRQCFFELYRAAAD